MTDDIAPNPCKSPVAALAADFRTMSPAEIDRRLDALMARLDAILEVRRAQVD
jgi:hypothetical protein